MGKGGVRKGGRGISTTGVESLVDIKEAFPPYSTLPYPQIPLTSPSQHAPAFIPAGQAPLNVPTLLQRLAAASSQTSVASRLSALLQVSPSACTPPAPPPPPPPSLLFPHLPTFPPLHRHYLRRL